MPNLIKIPSSGIELLYWTDE